MRIKEFGPKIRLRWTGSLTTTVRIILYDKECVWLSTRMENLADISELKKCLDEIALLPLKPE